MISSVYSSSYAAIVAFLRIASETLSTLSARLLYAPVCSLISSVPSGIYFCNSCANCARRSSSPAVRFAFSRSSSYRAALSRKTAISDSVLAILSSVFFFNSLTSLFTSLILFPTLSTLLSNKTRPAVTAAIAPTANTQSCVLREAASADITP